MRKLAIALAFAGVAGLSVGSESLHAQAEAPPGGEFQKVSELVELPEFVPGLGVLYVNPATLPAGPFLAYDRDGNLVSTVYMVPMSSLTEQESLTALDAADQAVDHVDFHFNAGHPGVPEPHYHVILWHVSPERAASLQ